MKINILFLTLLFLCGIHASAQDGFSSRVSRETETSKTISSSVSVRSDLVECNTYEGAKSAALAQAFAKCMQHSDSKDVELSVNDDVFEKTVELDIHVKITVRKTYKGTFEASCSISGDGKEILDHYPKR